MSQTPENGRLLQNFLIRTLRHNLSTLSLCFIALEFGFLGIAAQALDTGVTLRFSDCTSTEIRKRRTLTQLFYSAIEQQPPSRYTTYQTY